MRLSPLIQQLIQAFCCLPGVGPKSAQRMAFHLLIRNRSGGEALAEALNLALATVGSCSRCRMLTEDSLCHICADPLRDSSLLCIVESPADVLAIEQSGSYHGFYFVLLGHLSPLDGIGPAHIGLDKLAEWLANTEVKEIILATSLTVEGEATAHYIADLVRARPVKLSRIAQGVPSGGELAVVDSSTLMRALTGRVLLTSEV